MMTFNLKLSVCLKQQLMYVDLQTLFAFLAVQGRPHTFLMNIWHIICIDFPMKISINIYEKGMIMLTKKEILKIGLLELYTCKNFELNIKKINSSSTLWKITFNHWRRYRKAVQGVSNSSESFKAIFI